MQHRPELRARLLSGRSLTAITNTQSYEAANGIIDPFFPLPANQQVYQFTTSSIYGAPSAAAHQHPEELNRLYAHGPPAEAPGNALKICRARPCAFQETRVRVH